MKLTNEQWNIIEPLLRKPPRLDKRGKARKNNRDVLEGILWILKTGAQWRELPERYPSYQTCHRRLQEWRDRGIFEKILYVIAKDMEKRGKIKLKECFIDGTFASAKKGALLWARRSVEKAQKSWLFRTKALFQSPSIWPLLLRMKSLWWKKQLPKDLPERIQDYLWLTGHTTLIP